VMEVMWLKALRSFWRSVSSEEGMVVVDAMVAMESNAQNLWHW
jgi:hypothetical protein